jgi:hypothetical protein
MKFNRIFSFGIAWSLAAAAAAQQPEPAGLKPVEVTIAEVKGDVHVKRPADAAWSVGAKDAKLPENSEVATGLNSMVKLISSDAIEIVVKHASYLKVTRSAISQAASSTKLDLQYGSMEVDVKRTEGRANLMSIRAPNATTSISGTKVVILALGSPGGSRQPPVHALVMFKEGTGQVFKTVAGEGEAPTVMILVGEREAIAVLGTLPVDNLVVLASTAIMPYTGLFVYESVPVDGLIVEDILILGDPLAGQVQGSSTSPNQVVVNAASGTVLPEPPPPPPRP